MSLEQLCSSGVNARNSGVAWNHFPGNEERTNTSQVVSEERKHHIGSSQNFISATVLQRLTHSLTHCVRSAM